MRAWMGVLVSLGVMGVAEAQPAYEKVSETEMRVTETITHTKVDIYSVKFLLDEEVRLSAKLDEIRAQLAQAEVLGIYQKPSVP